MSEEAVLGDLELDEIMRMVGESVGSEPVKPTKAPPKKAAKPIEKIEAEVDDEIDAILADASDEGATPMAVAAVEPLVESVADPIPLDDVLAEMDSEKELEAMLEVEESSVEEEVVGYGAVESEEVSTSLGAADPAVATPGKVFTVVGGGGGKAIVEELGGGDDYEEPVKKDGVVYYINPARLKRDVSFSPHDIDNAMMTHASHYVHYGVQQSLARAQFERMKAAFEILESQLDNKHRSVLKEENPKTTEAQIRAAVVSDASWKAGNARLIECRSVYDLSSIALEAFSQRRDTLLQMAKTLREERAGELRLTEIKTSFDGQRERVMSSLGKPPHSAVA